MDGDRNRPPAKVAENWSRRDGIRAGAVSGPWRSAPRREGAAVPTEAVTEEALEAGLPVTTLQTPRASPARSTGRRLWLAAGGLAVVLVVVGALLLRGAGAPVELSAAPTPAPAVGFGVGAPALAGIAAVRVRIPASVSEARKEAVVAALTSGGIPRVTVEAVPFEIGSSRVGYYRAEDEAAASALAVVAGPMVMPSGQLPLRNYGPLADDRGTGRLDLWVKD